MARQPMTPERCMWGRSQVRVYLVPRTGSLCSPSFGALIVVPLPENEAVLPDIEV